MPREQPCTSSEFSRLKVNNDVKCKKVTSITYIFTAEGGLSAGEIAGIVVGVVAGVILIALCVILIIR